MIQCLFELSPYAPDPAAALKFGDVAVGRPPGPTHAPAVISDGNGWRDRVPPDASAIHLTVIQETGSTSA